MRTNEVSLLEVLRSRLPPGSRPSKTRKVDVLFSLRAGPARRSGVRSFHILYADGTPVARSLRLEEVLDAFASLLQTTVAEHSRRGLFVHAGVIEWNGAAIVIPGRTFSGKSTLVLEFVRAGARYYSDEYAIIDEKGLVHPFPRTISMRNDQLREQIEVSEIGGSIGRRAIPAGWILVTSFRPGMRWRPRTITPGETLLALLANTVPARQRPKEALEAFHRVVERAVGLKGARGEASQLVLQFLSRWAAR